MNAPQPSLDSIFCTAIEIPAPEERAEYIARVCGDNQGMREQVERLVAAHFRAADFLDSPAEPHPAGARLETHEYQTLPEPTTASTAPQVGAMVAGRYKLLEAIGDGGMGTVWLAEQTEPVRRKVALKLIKPGMDSRQVLARFEAERQALALMDHPNIAKVLDAGTTPDGRPFFAMELVKGVPITKFCDEHRLTPQQRLALFVPVCQAVQHAHQKGVIHRDIKPNNVMVAKYDDRPVPKVIDFGVAKATGQQLTEQTLNTAFGSVVGTVEYMSPEQASFNQLDVDTRSDIYSLGVLLYELLTGSPPFGKQELANAGLLEMLRVIREKEPAKPSTKLSSSDALPTLSANRGTEPKRLTRLLRGELDWIVMKALEKDRSRRYETANGLSMDIQRFLADEPVEACPPTTGYRFRKFIRRNRGAVIAGTTMLLLFVAGIVGTTIGLFRARAAEGDALWQRDRKDEALQNESQARLSERQALQSESLARRQTRQALNTVTDEVLDDLLGRQPQLTEKHREFLKNLLRFHAEFAAAKADDPDGRESRAEGYYRVGRIRKTLGQVNEAEAAVREAVALQRNLVQEFGDRPEWRQALVKYCLYLGEVMGENRLVIPVQPNQEIIEVYREALAHARQLDSLFKKPEYRRDLGKAAYNLGTFLYYDRRADEAEPLIRESLAIDKQLQEELGEMDDYANSLAIGHEQLARVLFTQG
ncbi:MAG TPA: serine/threonine-protein kinase, partial [Gemmata sp.]|nr:serine/threonine-protein kinase [Gemmata sp.]